MELHISPYVYGKDDFLYIKCERKLYKCLVQDLSVEWSAGISDSQICLSVRGYETKVDIND